MVALVTIIGQPRATLARYIDAESARPCRATAKLAGNGNEPWQVRPSSLAGAFEAERSDEGQNRRVALVR